MTVVQIDGLSEIRSTLSKFGVDIDKAIERALHNAAKEVIQLSSDKVPVQTGHLRDSVYFTLSGDSVEVGYKAPYAVDVHERTERPGAKFLENALNEFSGVFLEVFAKGLAREINNV